MSPRASARRIPQSGLWYSAGTLAEPCSTSQTDCGQLSTLLVAARSLPESKLAVRIQRRGCPAPSAARAYARCIAGYAVCPVGDERDRRAGGRQPCLLEAGVLRCGSTVLSQERSALGGGSDRSGATPVLHSGPCRPTAADTPSPRHRRSRRRSMSCDVSSGPIGWSSASWSCWAPVSSWRSSALRRPTRLSGVRVWLSGCACEVSA